MLLLDEWQTRGPGWVSPSFPQVHELEERGWSRLQPDHTDLPLRSFGVWGCRRPGGLIQFRPWNPDLDRVFGWDKEGHIYCNSHAIHSQWLVLLGLQGSSWFILRYTCLWKANAPYLDCQQILMFWASSLPGESNSWSCVCVCVCVCVLARFLLATPFIGT